MNRCAFSFDLKTFNDGDFLISNGKLFHSFGAAQANARSPSVIFVLYDGICSNKYLDSDKLSFIKTWNYFSVAFSKKGCETWLHQLFSSWLS